MDIFSAVGNTPLFELKSFGDEKRGIHILTKGEFLNISGSVKDRAAKAMILDGILSREEILSSILVVTLMLNSMLAKQHIQLILGV